MTGSAGSRTNDETTTTPLIWLVISDKAGDNAQAELIARSLGLPYRIKRVMPRKKYVFGKPRFRASLYHIDTDRSDPLQPPWPNLIITVGRRSSMVALWIKQQAPDTRIVLLGRPRRWLEKFDLIISPIQYRVPDRPNVVRLNLPLFELNPQRLTEAREAWSARLANLKKPIIALLVGGPTRPLYMDSAVIDRLLEGTLALVDDTGGSLYASTSRRTPAAVVEHLASLLPASATLYRWGDPPEDNPYQALLSHADYFIVTGDSVSMMVEVIKAGKQLAIFPLPSRWWGRHWQAITNWLHPAAPCSAHSRLAAAVGRLLYQLGWVGFPRDLTRIHAYLTERGLASMFAEPFPDSANAVPDELAEVSQRIHALLK